MRLCDTLVQLVSYQNQDAVEIDPDDKNYQTSNRTIQKVVGRDIGDIEVKQNRSHDKHTCKQK